MQEPTISSNTFERGVKRRNEESYNLPCQNGIIFNKIIKKKDRALLLVWELPLISFHFVLQNDSGWKAFRDVLPDGGPV